MLYRLLVFLLGLILTSLGVSFLLIYLSLGGNNVSFFPFLGFLITRKEIYLIPIGLIILIFALFFDETWKRFISWRKRRKSQNPN